MTSNRFNGLDDLVSWFNDSLDQPLADAAGNPVESGAYLREVCFDMLNYTQDEEIRSRIATTVSTEKSRFRTSMPMAMGGSCPGPSNARSKRLSGMLSIVSKPTSSSALIAVVRPAPDAPVTITTRALDWLAVIPPFLRRDKAAT